MNMSVEALLSLEKYLLYLNFISLSIAFVFSLKLRNLNSTILALGIMMVFNFLMTKYTPSLYEASIKHQAEYLHEFRALWYLGFSFWDLLIISLVFFTHHRFGLQRAFCANAVLVAYTVKMQLHIATYIEKEFVGGGYLDSIYKSGIPTINMIFASVIFGFVLTVLVSLLLSKLTRFKGVSWKI
jgi:hypothetical protein